MTEDCDKSYLQEFVMGSNSYGYFTINMMARSLLSHNLISISIPSQSVYSIVERVEDLSSCTMTEGIKMYNVFSCSKSHHCHSKV